MGLNGKEFAPITTATIPDSLDFEPFAEKYLVGVDPYFHGKIALSFGISASAHKGQPRQSGEPYFSHPLMCTIYLIETGFTDPSLITGTLLHDVKEDALKYLKKAKEKLDEARDLNRHSEPALTTDEYWDQYWADNEEQLGKSEFLSELFGDETARFVNAVSKTKGMTDERYAEKVDNGPSGGWVIKGGDNLHNLRTLGPNPFRIRRKIDETTGLYLPIFRKAAKEYPGPGEKLLWLIEEELGGLESGLAKLKSPV